MGLFDRFRGGARQPENPPAQAADYERRDVMIAMRDGVSLHTVIMVPKGARRAPIILTRTPYNASKRAERAPSNHLAGSLGSGETVAPRELQAATHAARASGRRRSAHRGRAGGGRHPTRSEAEP